MILDLPRSKHPISSSSVVAPVVLSFSYPALHCDQGNSAQHQNLLGNCKPSALLCGNYIPSTPIAHSRSSKVLPGFFLPVSDAATSSYYTAPRYSAWPPGPHVCYRRGMSDFEVFFVTPAGAGGHKLEETG